MKIAIFLAMTFALGVGSCARGMQKEAVKAASKEEIRATINDILQATFERAVHRKSDGTAESLNLALLHVTDENRKRVRDYGDAAVNVLKEYVTDYENWRQRAALELLCEFKTDQALGVLVNFTEHLKVRDIAVSYMAQYPIDKTQPVLKKLLSDPDELVRDAAKRTLTAYGQK
jgi:HEAT repeat protein